MARGLVVDLFAGGGGASVGLTRAGFEPDIAINHDPEAIAMHAANHPRTKHYTADIWEVAPRDATGGLPVDLLWMSPNCTHFSRAKGGKPLDRGNRALAHVGVRWAREVRPAVIMAENVAEWLKWGPLDADDRPRPDKVGHTWRRFVRQFERLGYRCGWWVLRACDYGAPTTRERVYFVATLEGDPTCPAPTHAEPGNMFGLLPWRTASEIIDWSLPCPSIFDRKKPLAEATLRRIASGVWRHVINAADPFIVTMRGTEDSHIASSARSIHEPVRTVSANGTHHAVVAPTLVQTSYGEREGQAPRVLNLHEPLGTVVAGGQKHALVAAFIARNYGGPNGNTNAGSSVGGPLPTVTTQDHNALITARLGGPDRRREVRAFLTTYYGTDQNGDLRKPLHTVTTRDRFGLVTVDDIHDLGMRLLVARELARANDFSDDYILDPIFNGKPLSKTAQVRMVGNSVCPNMAEAFARANLGDRRSWRAA